MNASPRAAMESVLESGNRDSGRSSTSLEAARCAAIAAKGDGVGKGGDKDDDAEAGRGATAGVDMVITVDEVCGSAADRLDADGVRDAAAGSARQPDRDDACRKICTHQKKKKISTF